MYKYLLCWRYLRTRYIALASVVSVMLGVATMIVVNSVMAGFSEKMRDRLHGVLADIVVESRDFDGFRNSDEVMARIRQIAGDQVEAMAPTMETVGLMTWKFNGHPVTKQVLLIGVEPQERARTGDFAEFLFDERSQKIPPSFTVPERVKRNVPEYRMLQDETDPIIRQALIDKMNERAGNEGVIIGWAMGHAHFQGKDVCIAPPPTKMTLVFPQRVDAQKVTSDTLPVIGFFKSGMSEYDSTHVYVPLKQLQRMRVLGDGEGKGAVNQIQLKVKEGTDLDELAYRIQEGLDRLHPLYFSVSTWEQKQGALLAAVAVEQSILNILLFFIIAVAGFGILAIFSMIVVEKTRDIGVLKALGASTAGVRGIFLGYGLSLGLVGSGVGMVGGLLFVRYINDIETLLSKVTGRKVFDDSIYYFSEIPTLVEPRTVLGIVGGALLIAIAASVWPAQRASKLQPVQALRFE
jgi:lipoprotein-releasing system permease protein